VRARLAGAVLVLLMQQAAIWCPIHMAYAAFEGIEPGVDGALYYEYCHDKGTKREHCFLRSR